VAGVVVLATLLTGCGAVHLNDAEVSATDRKACTALVDDVPHRVSERARRDTTGGDLGAAWGDPAIVLSCGVGTPEGYQPGSPCQRANGVDWFVPEDQISDQDKDVVLTTIGRKPNVEVVVPAEYRPPDAAMVDLAEVIKKHTKVVEPCS
jgi:Protein of unknown function (DUF3515)